MKVLLLPVFQARIDDIKKANPDCSQETEQLMIKLSSIAQKFLDDKKINNLPVVDRGEILGNMLKDAGFSEKEISPYRVEVAGLIDSFQNDVQHGIIDEAGQVKPSDYEISLVMRKSHLGRLQTNTEENATEVIADLRKKRKDPLEGLIAAAAEQYGKTGRVNLAEAIKASGFTPPKVRGGNDGM